ncbi:MAG TPA: tyrosine-type recombinase/integrase [Methanospirillum sp.]|nr:tyrosine-type recombinase/integrase [Methanospirillum sp.]
MSFYLGEIRDYEVRSINKALENNQISQSDATLIKQYISEKIACDRIGRNRILKLNTTLLGWRKNRLITCEYKDLTMADLFSAMQNLDSTISQSGKPLAKNTQHDYVVILKGFMTWMMENGINMSLIEKKVRSIKTPPKNMDTTHPDQILTPDEIRGMIRSRKSTRDRALIAVQYEAATRIGELGRMVWRDVQFDDYGARLLIHDTKTKKTRFSRITKATSSQYLAAWRDDYPGIPEGDAPVFLSERGGTLSYYAIRKIFLDAATVAGIEKHVCTHLFRKSRGTHLIEQGLPDASVKDLMWGNQSTRMLDTYIRISPVEQDRILLKHAGVITDEQSKQQERRLSGVMCSICHMQNSPTSRYCAGCGTGLTEEAARIHKEGIALAQDPRLLQAAIEKLLGTQFHG